MILPARLLYWVLSFLRKFSDMLPAFDAYFYKIWYEK